MTRHHHGPVYVVSMSFSVSFFISLSLYVFLCLYSSVFWLIECIMYICAHVCMHTHTHTHTHTRTHTHAHTHTHRESKATHWSILDRMRLVGENIKPVAETPGGMSWLYTLLRFNQVKLVPLTRNANYQVPCVCVCVCVCARARASLSLAHGRATMRYRHLCARGRPCNKQQKHATKYDLRTRISRARGL